MDRPADCACWKPPCCGCAIMGCTLTRVAFRILGPLEALVDGRRVDMSSRRERALVGALLLRVGEVASVDTLIDSVWGDHAPASARHMVHEYVSRVRGEFGDASVISTRAPGYTIERDACELDATRFAELLRTARSAVAADQLDQALKAFDQALGLWRGDTLSDVELEADARSAAARLDDEHRAARSERFDVALALGHHNELIPDLERAVAAEPLDEHLLRQLMTALYRSGRQADALARYRNGRQRLVRELGIEPAAELRTLEQAILQHDSGLAPPASREATPENAAAASAPTRRRIAWGVAIVVSVGAATAVLAATLVKAHPGAAEPVHGNAVAVVDAATAQLLGSVAVDSRPAAIAYGAGSIWVSSPDARSVARISPSSRRVVASIPLDTPAQGLAATNRSLWAVGSSPTDSSLTLDQIDPTFDTVARVWRLPMVVLGDGGSIAAERNSVVVAPRAGFLTRIDARSGRTLSRIDPNIAPTAVAQGFGSSWLAYREANLVVRVDATGAITTIPVGRGPSAVTVGRRAVWVADALGGTVKSIDPATSSVETTVEVGSAPSAIAEGDGSIWVANAGDGTLTRIDERTSRPSAHVAVGGIPQALVVADGKVWVSVQPPAAEPSGGTLVVSVPADITLFDPAVAEAIDDGPIMSAICSTLMSYPDEPGLAGLRLAPDAARAAPIVSDGGRSYTFVIRPGLRFSPPSNELVTAETFMHTIERSLSPRKSMGLGGSGPGQQELTDVVGAAAYVAGKAEHIAGISARGDRLTIRLTHPGPDLPERLATSPFCAVPSNMPLRPVRGRFPSAGPYYIAATTPGRTLVLLRNPNYHGDRPRRPQRIDVVIGPQHPIEDVEASRLDYAIDGVPADRSAGLERLYGAGSPAARHGQQQYFVVRYSEVDMIRLNTSRPLFATARMRRAANYAVDRRALAANGGSFYAHATVAQMLLPPGEPGFRDEHIYPLRPDVAAARRLAGPGRHTALLYCYLGGGGPRAARIIVKNLAAIGIDVQVKCFPGDQFWTRMLTPGAPWDLAVDGWGGDPADPGDYLDGYASRAVYNASHLHDPRVDSLLASAARKSGLARDVAYARVDHVLVHDVAAAIAFANESKHEFFSARISCQHFWPAAGVDLGALCIRTRPRRG
jgi:DNA-binding SARP family transcriptional activator/ABC-type transport system substrate-binding protein